MELVWRLFVVRSLSFWTVVYWNLGDEKYQSTNKMRQIVVLQPSIPDG